MLNKPAKTLNEASDQPEKGSVYDFLYQDSRRIASFLGQFDKNGHLTALTTTRTATDSAGSDSTTGGSAGISGIVNVNASGIRHVSESASDVASRTYDPLWQNSLALLDYLEQGDLICRGLGETKIGQFALMTGRLIVVDIAMIKAVLLSKRGAERLGRSIVDAEDTKDKVAKTKKERDSELALAAELVQSMFKSFPSAVTTYLIGADFSIWSTVSIEGLSITIDDLVLKHGASPAGEWNMLGIVDALPDPDAEKEQEAESDPFFEEGTAAKAIADLFTKMRPSIGRPRKSYGMTPLLIFRKVLAN